MLISCRTIESEGGGLCDMNNELLRLHYGDAERYCQQGILDEVDTDN